MLDVIIDALIDSLKLLPFLFIVYVIIEIIENKTVNFFKEKQENNKKYGPILGSIFGVIPQCGFGVVATKLFSKRYITIGTLIAIYLATSDEAIPIMLSNPNSIAKLLPFLIVKIIYSFVVGYILDLFIFKNKKLDIVIEDVDDGSGCCGHDIDHHEESNFKKYFFHPVIHSLKIFIYILLINFILGTIIFLIGEDNLMLFMNNNKYLQPLLSVLVGLIPNCASSVVITQLYITNALTFGAAMAGLCANAGIALAVLFKENKNIKENLAILGILVISSLFIGYLIILL